MNFVLSAVLALVVFFLPLSSTALAQPAKPANQNGDRPRLVVDGDQCAADIARGRIDRAMKALQWSIKSIRAMTIEPRMPVAINQNRQQPDAAHDATVPPIDPLRRDGDSIQFSGCPLQRCAAALIR